MEVEMQRHEKQSRRWDWVKQGNVKGLGLPQGKSSTYISDLTERSHSRASVIVILPSHVFG